MGWVINARPWPLYLGKETWYPLYRRLGGPQGRSGRVRKAYPPPGFDPRNVQPVASRYTHWAIPAHIVVSTSLQLCLFKNECLTKAKTPGTRRIGPLVTVGRPKVTTTKVVRLNMSRPPEGRASTPRRTVCQWLGLELKAVEGSAT